jgi:hypothetical protein
MEACDQLSEVPLANPDKRNDLRDRTTTSLVDKKFKRENENMGITYGLYGRREEPAALTTRE